MIPGPEYTKVEVKAVTDTLSDYNAQPTVQAFPFKPMPPTDFARFQNPKELTFAPMPGVGYQELGGMDIVMEKRRYRTRPRKRK